MSLCKQERVRAARDAVCPSPVYVRINSITVDDTGHYVGDYETFGYTEQLPGMHIHFFFNTVRVEQAGSPGSGPWYLYGGPLPFTKYSEADRSADATQICALAPNKNHSIIPDSGNCVNLPEHKIRRADIRQPILFNF